MSRKEAFPWQAGAPWDALDGDAPLSDLADWLRAAAASPPLRPSADEVDTKEQADFVRVQLHLRQLCLRIAAAMDPSGTSLRQLKLVSRGQKRPNKTPHEKRSRRHREMLAVEIVERLSKDMKQEAAVAEARRLTGIGRGPILAALSLERKRRSGELFAEWERQEQSAKVAD